MTSTYAMLLHKLEAEIIFALIMPLCCSAEAVMTDRACTGRSRLE